MVACLAPPGANTSDQGADYRRHERELTQQLRVFNVAFPEYFSEVVGGRRGMYNSVHAGLSMGGGQTVIVYYPNDFHKLYLIRPLL